MPGTNIPGATVHSGKTYNPEKHQGSQERHEGHGPEHRPNHGHERFEHGYRHNGEFGRYNPFHRFFRRGFSDFNFDGIPDIYEARPRRFFGMFSYRPFEPFFGYREPYGHRESWFRPGHREGGHRPHGPEHGHGRGPHR